MPKVGDVRIVKSDALNYAVQEYTETGKAVMDDDGKRIGVTKTGAEWKDKGYYGNHLEWAVGSALMIKVPAGAELLGEYKKAAQEIIAAMKAEAIG